MANSSKFSVHVAATRSIKSKSKQGSLFAVITSSKYKFVLCFLKEDERNRSVSVYHDIIKFFNT